MAGGFNRFNEKKKRPNERIAFIKPLAGPDQVIAQDILERVAAKVVPIMRKKSLSITSLDEFPANREFWGRGECVELVLKSSRGLWLPFRMIVNTLIHELAHIREMNHSRYFWRVKNEFQSGLDALSASGYTGEEFWGKGEDLASVVHTTDRPLLEEEMPQNICGGYRRRSRKRKRKGRKRRFAGEGSSIGGDENTRFVLEGKFTKGRPRVAQSKRGRELRAAAALARFAGQNVDSELAETETESESGSDDGFDEAQASEDDEAAKDEMRDERAQFLHEMETFT